MPVTNHPLWSSIALGMPCLQMVDTKITKKMHQIFPSYKGKIEFTRNIAILALGIVTPMVVGYKVGQYAGYEISPLWWVLGSSVGGIAHAIVQQKLKEDPFKGVDILTINKNNFQKKLLSRIYLWL